MRRILQVDAASVKGETGRGHLKYYEMLHDILLYVRERGLKGHDFFFHSKGGA